MRGAEMKYISVITITILLVIAPFLTGTAFAAEQSSVSAYSGYPIISIESVVEDDTVTIEATNLPAHDKFAVLMNLMGTRGVDGYRVGTVYSGGGGTLTTTFDIPTELQGEYRIAIRYQSVAGTGYYSYNWFYNNTSDGSSTGSDTDSDNGTSSGYTGYPVFKIDSVVRDTSVTIKIENLPSDDEFKTLMNYYGTRGVNGVKVRSFGTGEGGSLEETFTIPEEFHGLAKIAIRIESKTGSGYYAYNWFYNNTTP
jgi:hypothetical protein